MAKRWRLGLVHTLGYPEEDVSGKECLVKNRLFGIRLLGKALSYSNSENFGIRVGFQDLVSLSEIWEICR